MTDLPEGKFSGGPIDDFTGGWARIPFVGMKGHYWNDQTDTIRALIAKDGGEPPAADARLFVSLCNVFGRTDSRVPPLHVGTIGLCKRCQKKAPRWTRKEERATFLETHPEAAEALRRG